MTYLSIKIGLHTIHTNFQIYDPISSELSSSSVGYLNLLNVHVIINNTIFYKFKVFSSSSAKRIKHMKKENFLCGFLRYQKYVA